ncbi:Na+/H+ antiporter NhaC family protein [Luminiphilus sp.]|nr:Na+/H+ antiporter NhaC family protein [Luminiphilus sp.]MDA9625305.1 Na+/H+ antiporter NhaC family protein [Luminiphilus sp.]
MRHWLGRICNGLRWTSALLCLITSTHLPAAEINAPQVFLDGIHYQVTVELDEASDQPVYLRIGQQQYDSDQMGQTRVFSNIVLSDRGNVTLELIATDQVLAAAEVPVIPAWISILPPLVAIGMALLLRSVLPALMLGIWLGAWALEGMTLKGFFYGLFSSFEVYVVNAVADRDHVTIMLFTFMIAGMVGIISRNGGMNGIVELIIKGANSAKRGQLAVWSLGLLIFFDDYSNTLVVGNTSRSITDRLRISREKLAYLVDSTAAPIATVALVTTWIGYQVSLIGDAIAPLEDLNTSAYSLFLNSVLYSFYPFMAILLVVLVITTGREFGPMLTAERRARSTGITAPPVKLKVGQDDEAALAMKPGMPPRAINALVPVAVMVIGILAGLYITGEGDSVGDIVGSANSYRALMWASLLSAFTAVLMTAAQRLLTLDEIVDAWVSGARFTFLAMIILVLAWSMSEISQELHTAAFLIASFGDSLPAEVLPATVFVLAAFTAFSTGSSWGAMGILLPLVLPLTWAIMGNHGLTDPHYHYLLHASISGVLAGAVWGDHCSPISDTTVLSSLSAGCDHIEHVRTQLPYALLAGAAALLFGTLPISFGLPWWGGDARQRRGDRSGIAPARTARRRLSTRFLTDAVCIAVTVIDWFFFSVHLRILSLLVQHQ